MQPNPTAVEPNLDHVYNKAAEMLLHKKMTETEVVNALMIDGIDEAQASNIVTSLQEQIAVAKKRRANKDMLYGALWCIGGTIATIADTGYIFWGAILFGGIQFFRGVMNSNS